MRAYPIPMEEAATTVPRSIPRQRPPIIPVADLTIQVAAVITHSHAVTTRHRRGTTSQRRGITISRGFINRHLVITSRNGATTGPMVGTGETAAVGAMTTVAMADEATIMDAAITMAEAAVGNS